MPQNTSCYSQKPSVAPPAAGFTLLAPQASVAVMMIGQQRSHHY